MPSLVTAALKLRCLGIAMYSPFFASGENDGRSNDQDARDASSLADASWTSSRNTDKKSSKMT